MSDMKKRLFGIGFDLSVSYLPQVAYRLALKRTFNTAL